MRFKIAQFSVAELLRMCLQARTSEGRSIELTVEPMVVFGIRPEETIKTVNGNRVVGIHFCCDDIDKALGHSVAADCDLAWFEIETER